MEKFLSFTRSIIPRRLLLFLQPAYHLLLAALAALYYGFPSRHLTVIGVTGTNGKTTVVHLLHEIFAAAGFKAGSLSSLRFKINNDETPNLLKMTMPGRLQLQKFLAQCRASSCRFVILEVTSEGIKQFRHRFIQFRAAVLTNVTPEHIESHGSFERYRDAKLELFRCLPPSGWAVLNREDESAELFKRATAAKIVWYSASAIELERVGHPVHLLKVESSYILADVDDAVIEAPLGGFFNAQNLLAAVAAALAFQISLSAIAQAVHRFPGVPGRLEYVSRTPFAVVVDYAHTPDALEKVYQVLQSARLPDGQAERKAQSGGLICVLGSAGGGRDKWKRPELGRIISRYCQEIILTSEDPDEEDPDQIASAIQSGMPNDKIQMPKVILDRRTAIREALRSAHSGDTVVITGMGAQPWFIEKGKKIPWDERRIVREELAKIQNKSD